jgi:hypothetical protein
MGAVGAITGANAIMAADQVFAVAAKGAARTRRTPMTLDTRLVVRHTRRGQKLLEPLVELRCVRKLHDLPFTPFVDAENKIAPPHGRRATKRAKRQLHPSRTHSCAPRRSREAHALALDVRGETLGATSEHRQARPRRRPVREPETGAGPHRGATRGRGDSVRGRSPMRRVTVRRREWSGVT